ncbi:hypothetical protein [Angustibacter luteus]|uniref:Uncharacterized protein n=1 Tax=Angustibacter luteus TaxID=658456 RepID=A0ABW1JCD0_9ACTN
MLPSPLKLEGESVAGHEPPELLVFWDNGHVVELHLTKPGQEPAVISLGPNQTVALRNWLTGFLSAG